MVVLKVSLSILLTFALFKAWEKMVVLDHEEKKFIKDTKEGTIFLKNIDYNPEKNLSLISIKLKTGLRHQIRPAFHLGFPILGDELYGGLCHQESLHAFYYEVPLRSGFVIKGIAKKADLFEKFFNLNRFFEMVKNESFIFRVVNLTKSSPKMAALIVTF